jgi:type II secretory pathway component GspD/PulD (secretin)
MLRDVREVLRVLDSNDIPDSLRDMQPRSIVVEHGDVDQIAGIIRDIYKPLMEAQGGDRRQQQQNPFAALMGGGRGGDESQQIRMTLGVDRNTSTLIVSSSADVFAGVQELVQNLDESARTANRMIRVVPLKHADASQIQQSLSSLLPRVSVSTSRTSGGSSGGSGNTSPAAPGSSNNNDDAAAQAFRDQMRARFGGGGDGGRPSFGGFGGGGGGRPSFGGGGGFPGLNRGGGGRSGGRR